MRKRARCTGSPLARQSPASPSQDSITRVNLRARQPQRPIIAYPHNKAFRTASPSFRNSFHAMLSRALLLLAASGSAAAFTVPTSARAATRLSMVSRAWPRACPRCPAAIRRMCMSFLSPLSPHHPPPPHLPIVPQIPDEDFDRKLKTDSVLKDADRAVILECDEMECAQVECVQDKRGNWTCDGGLEGGEGRRPRRCS